MTCMKENVDVVILPKKKLKNAFREMSFDSFSEKLAALFEELKENFIES